MNSEATPVVLVYLSQEDYQRNKITMMTERNGQMVMHKQIDGTKIIDGEVIESQVVSWKKN